MPRDRLAWLMGTPNKPFVRLEFNPHEQVSKNDYRTLLEWVKEFPTRRFNRAESAWDVYAFESDDPYLELRKAGFVVTDWDGETDGVRETMAQYRASVLAKISSNRSLTLVRARLMPFQEASDLLGPGAQWDKAKGRFEVQTTDIIEADGSWPFGIEFVDPDPAAVAAEIRAAACQKPKYASADDVKIPEWFGLDLYGYQREGAIAAIVENKTLLADPPGLGKTRSALAVVGTVGAERTLVVTPPVMLTGWRRESEASGIQHKWSPSGKKQADGEVVVIVAGRKEPELPERGVVVVSDSLVASRAPLREKLHAWNPDALVVDEAHRLKTWGSQRSKAIREIATNVKGPRLALTGTPLFANPVELAGVMGITGHLDTVFDGYGKFVVRYAHQNRFKAWVARKPKLPELRQRLRENVWVRRERDDVLDLPPLSRHTLYTDVDLKGFNQAHKEVIERIDEWIADIREVFKRDPNREEIHSFAANNLYLVTMLRRAAGLAKIEAAQDLVAEWVESSPKSKSTGEWPNPLILWTHHKDVSHAMYEAAVEATGDPDAVAAIMGGTSQDERTKIVDDFQAGKIAVLVASITAAGVGITLTRSTDAYYVETDWTPALIQQADYRVLRIGQTRPCQVTTLVAPGTLDEYIHKALAKKGEILSAIIGGDQDVSADIEEDVSTPIQIITDMCNDRVAGRRVSNVRSKRAKKPRALVEG